MNWLDIVLGILLGFFLLRGLSRGVVKEIVDISAVLVTIILAGRFGGSLGLRIADILGWSPDLSSLLGFVAIALGVAIVALTINLMWSTLAQLSPLSFFDKAGGALVGIIKASILILIFLVILTSLPMEGSSAFITESRLASAYIHMLPAVYRVLEPVWPESWPRLLITPDGWWLQENPAHMTITGEV